MYLLSHLCERSRGIDTVSVRSSKHTPSFHHLAQPRTLVVYPRPWKQTKSIIKIHYRLQTTSSNKDVNAYTHSHIQTVWKQWGIVNGQPLCHVSKRSLSHANVPVRAERSGSHDAVNPDLLSNTKEGLNRGLVIAGCQILPPTMQPVSASAAHWGPFQVAFIYCCHGEGPFDWWGVDVRVCIGGRGLCGDQ